MAASYLVTGGCGFIGSHLVEALIARGDRVRVLDDLSSGSIENLPPGAVLKRGDVANPDDVQAAMEGVAGCFHLAAVASVQRSTDDWLGTHRTNLSGTIAVLDAARRCGQLVPIPVVYASSAAIYGDNSDLPLRETARPRPLSPYGADKYGSELHAAIASELHNVPTVGLRFFNVYGPRQNPHSPYSGVISIFCDRASRRQPIDIFGDGSQTRDFIFVNDVVKSLLAVMEGALDCRGVFNICSGKAVSILNLAHLVADLCGSKAGIRFQPPRPGEISHSCGDRTLVSSQLALPTPIDLRSGLAATLAWADNNHRGEGSGLRPLNS